MVRPPPSLILTFLRLRTNAGAPGVLTCTQADPSSRRSTLSLTDRAAFITAIHCLNALPARTPQSTAPGARTLYDDFIVAHILQTPFVHASGLFLPFHRHLLHLFADALRDRCGYSGPLPYWDWTTSYADPRTAAVFDGGPHSLGGNGAFVPGRNGTVISLPGGAPMVIPPATGGGCVTRADGCGATRRANSRSVRRARRQDAGPCRRSSLR